MQQKEYGPVLGQEQKAQMMRILIRNPEAFAQAKRHLKPEHFGEANAAYRPIWQIVVEYDAKHAKLPGRGVLVTRLEMMIKQDPDLLTFQQRAKARAFIATAFADVRGGEEDCSASEKSARAAIRMLKKFREESLLAQTAESCRPRKRMVADIMGLLNASREEMHEIATIGVPPARPFCEGWDKSKGIGIFSTGIPFLDTFLNGGHAPGEAYGFMGPYGSCKTTLAMMLCVEACRQAHRILQETGERQYVFLASYEAALENELRFRGLSYAAQIHMETFEKADPELGIKSFSTAETLKAYEKELFRNAILAGRKVLGEKGRLKKVIDILNKHLIVLDMTGAAPNNSGAGAGYVPEIANAIQYELSARGANAKACIAVIDYVGAMAERHLAAMELDDSALRGLVKRSGMMVKNLIASKFKCPVWLMHQLTGKANQRGVTTRNSHLDAAESKSFTENLDFAFVVSKPDEDGLCQLTCHRPRRTANMKRPQVIQVKGKLSTVVGVDSKYMVDPHTRKIKELAGGVIDGDSIQTQHQENNHGRSGCNFASRRRGEVGRTAGSARHQNIRARRIGRTGT